MYSVLIRKGCFCPLSAQKSARLKLHAPKKQRREIICRPGVKDAYFFRHIVYISRQLKLPGDVYSILIWRTHCVILIRKNRPPNNLLPKSGAFRLLRTYVKDAAAYFWHIYCLKLTPERAETFVCMNNAIVGMRSVCFKKNILGLRLRSGDACISAPVNGRRFIETGVNW